VGLLARSGAADGAPNVGGRPKEAQANRSHGRAAGPLQVPVK
jgi:hypothetical protein